MSAKLLHRAASPDAAKASCLFIVTYLYLSLLLFYCILVQLFIWLLFICMLIVILFALARPELRRLVATFHVLRRIKVMRLVCFVLVYVFTVLA